jgi:transcriptional regulator with XRE-family HTH domain
MKPVEYLYQIKTRHKITSDYALAAFLKISRARISDYVKGKTWPDVYASMQIAFALELDPLQVLADFESQSEKNEQKREFFRDFLSRAKKPFGVLVLALSFTAFLLAGGMDAKNDFKAALAVFMSSLALRIMYIMLNNIEMFAAILIANASLD